MDTSAFSQAQNSSMTHIAGHICAPCHAAAPPYQPEPTTLLLTCDRVINVTGDGSHKRKICNRRRNVYGINCTNVHRCTVIRGMATAAASACMADMFVVSRQQKLDFMVSSQKMCKLLPSKNKQVICLLEPNGNILFHYLLCY
jgi:hypothetical protein